MAESVGGLRSLLRRLRISVDLPEPGEEPPPASSTSSSADEQSDASVGVAEAEEPCVAPKSKAKAKAKTKAAAKAAAPRPGARPHIPSETRTRFYILYKRVGHEDYEAIYIYIYMHLVEIL